MPVSTRAGVAALFPPLTAEEFRRRHWPARELVAHGDPGRLSGLVEPFADLPIPDLMALPALERFAMEHRAEGAVRQFRIEAGHAPPLYEAGYSIVIRRPRIETLDEWLRAIEADLELPPERTSFDLFISPPHCAGTRAHWDPFELFEIQVRGRKHWTITRNADVLSPPVRHIVGTPPVADLTTIWPDGPRDAMPPGACELDMRPGSVLFMPRGHWHATAGTEEASVHLVLYCPTPTWIEMVLPEIRRRLLERPEWREPAVGAWSADPDPARRRLEALIEALPALLADLPAERLLDVRDFVARRRLVFPE